MKKYIFKWYETDGYTYGYDVIIPFECDDLDKFIYEAIRSVEKSDMGCANVLSVYMTKDNLHKLEKCFYTLEDWFEQEKNKII